jgi:hypothetical protein
MGLKSSKGADMRRGERAEVAFASSDKEYKFVMVADRDLPTRDDVINEARAKFLQVIATGRATFALQGDSRSGDLTRYEVKFLTPRGDDYSLSVDSRALEFRGIEEDARKEMRHRFDSARVAIKKEIPPPPTFNASDRPAQMM